MARRNDRGCFDSVVPMGHFVSGSYPDDKEETVYKNEQDQYV